MDDLNNNQEKPEITPEQTNETTTSQELNLGSGSNNSGKEEIEIKNKKSNKKIVAAVIAVLVLVVLGATAFAFKDRIASTFAVKTKSPAQYYAYVEKKAITSGLDKWKPYFNASTAANDIAVDMSTDITYDHDTVDSLLQSYMGLGLSDMESILGLSLDSIGFDITTAVNDLSIYENMGLRLNNASIITLDLFMDYAKQEMMIQVPELSSAYLTQNMAVLSEGESFDFSNLKDTFTADRVTDFLTRYSNILMENIQNVELQKDVAVSTQSFQTTAKQLTITLNEEDFNQIMTAVMTEMKDDAFIKDVLSTYGISEEEFLSSIEEEQQELETSYLGSTDDSALVMVLYVDDQDRIIGRKFSFTENNETEDVFGYKLVTDGNEEEYDFYFNNEDFKTNLIHVYGKHTKKDDKYTGSATVDIDGELFELPTDLSISIAYSDIYTKLEGNRSYAYGTYTISASALPGMDIQISSDVVDDIQQNQIVFRLGSSELVTLDTSIEYLDNYTIPEIPDTAETYDMVTDMNGYYNTINMEQFMSDLSDKLGVDIENIVSNMLPYFLY